MSNDIDIDDTDDSGEQAGMIWAMSAATEAQIDRLSILVTCSTRRDYADMLELLPNPAQQIAGAIEPDREHDPGYARELFEPYAAGADFTDIEWIYAFTTSALETWDKTHPA